MSAYVVDTAHVDALVSAGLAWGIGPGSPVRWFSPGLDGTESLDEINARHRTLRFEDAGRVAVMLYAENWASVLYRYPDCTTDDVPGPIPCVTPDEYTFHKLMGQPDPVVVLKAISCYEYQSCEHPGWWKSEARLFCIALREHTISRLAGYDSAPWEIQSRDVFSPYRVAS